MDTPSFPTCATGSNSPSASNSLPSCSDLPVLRGSPPAKSLPRQREEEITDLLKELAVKRSCGNMKLALGLMTLAFLVMLGAFLGTAVFALHLLKNQKASSGHPLLSSADGNEEDLPLRLQQNYQYIGLQDINRLPLDQLDQMQSLVLQWGSPGSNSEKQFLYSVASAVRDGAKNTTTLNLSSDHSLVAGAENAVLLDSHAQELGVLDFTRGASFTRTESPQKDESEEADQSPQGLLAVSTSSDSPVSGSSVDSGVRRLGRLMDALKEGRGVGRYPRNTAQGEPESMFDSYCRYGCGKLAITHPYYYRPFFGYGYPLVGTQAMFPQGYGGYPGADAMAQMGRAGGQGISAGGRRVLSSQIKV